MAKIFKPRRGLSTTLVSGSKKTTVLAAGELCVVSRGTTIGGTNKHDIYIGDGTTQFQNLKPALYGDTSNEDITITADSGNYAAAYANIVTGKTLGALLGSIKQAINKLNDDKLAKTGTATSATNAGTATYATNAGTASAVTWDNVKSKPTTFTAGGGSAAYSTQSGTATYATNSGTAVSATKDSGGQQINTTYIKNASVSGKVVTFTKGNGGTFSITTQDTNTTYSSLPANGGSAAYSTQSGTATYATNAGTASAVTWANVKSKPSTFTAGGGSAAYSTQSGTANYATNAGAAGSVVMGDTAFIYSESNNINFRYSTNGTTASTAYGFCNIKDIKTKVDKVKNFSLSGTTLTITD